MFSVRHVSKAPHGVNGVSSAGSLRNQRRGLTVSHIKRSPCQCCRKGLRERGAGFKDRTVTVGYFLHGEPKKTYWSLVDLKCSRNLQVSRSWFGLLLYLAPLLYAPAGLSLSEFKPIWTLGSPGYSWLVMRYPCRPHPKASTSAAIGPLTNKLKELAACNSQWVG